MIELIREPFNHAILDGLWSEDLLNRVVSDFPKPNNPRLIRYENENERKLHGDQPTWSDAAWELLEQFEFFTGTARELFGIPDLEIEFVGGGLHLIPPGGYLRMHTDFNRSPKTGRYRRVNLLCFLNRQWDEDPGGCLFLGRDREVKIVPEFNRTAIFESTDRSWHGHPEVNRRWRLSAAAYYFSEEPPEGYSEDHSTVWL